MSLSASYDFQAELRRFGLEQFRPGQREVIETVMSGTDCLCIMPTGGGKSLCYQLPAVMRPGVVLVVSPLIALMKDQVDSLSRQGIRGAFINSTLDAAAQAEHMDRMREGQFDLVYVAPSDSAARVSWMSCAHAHSAAGGGRGPLHQRMGARLPARLHSAGPVPPVAGQSDHDRADGHGHARCPAGRDGTAGAAVAQGLCGRLCTSEPAVCRPGAIRAAEKEVALERFLRGQPGSGIIYASTRKGCEEVAQIIADRLRRSVGAYHAGLEMEQRRKVQEGFMAGQLEIVVATNAFGMGIDKADVRFVVHYNFPGSIEAYYQEAGRAGRDGQPATCLLLFCQSDRYIQEFFIESAYPTPEAVEKVYQFLRNHEDDPIEITQQAIKEVLGLPLSAEGVGTCERLLEKCGVLKRVDPHRNMAVVVIDSDLPTLVDSLPPQARVRRAVLGALEQWVGPRRHETVYFSPQDLARTTSLALSSVTRALRELNQLRDFDYVPPFRGRAIHVSRRDLEFNQLQIDFDTLEKRRQADLDKLERMVRYARTHRCRQQDVLHYFGEKATDMCGHCDNCRARQGTPARAAKSVDAPAGDGVLQAVRIVLSGVARAHGRFGKTMIAAMLWGSKAAKLARWNLDRLSTFGLMSHLTQSEVSQIIDALIEARLLVQTEVDRFRPIVQLTDQGRQVMQGKLALDVPLQLPGPLRHKLSGLRRPPAAGHPPDPPYVDPPAVDPPAVVPPAVVPPAVVPPAAAPQPYVAAKSREGELEGSSKQQPRPRAETDVGPVLTVTGPPREMPTCPRPSFYWTWRLLADGYSADHCAAIRRLTPDQVLDHAVQAAEDGLHVDCRWLLTSAQLAMVRDLIARRGTSGPQLLVSAARGTTASTRTAVSQGQVLRPVAATRKTDTCGRRGGNGTRIQSATRRKNGPGRLEYPRGTTPPGVPRRAQDLAVAYSTGSTRRGFDGRQGKTGEKRDKRRRPVAAGGGSQPVGVAGSGAGHDAPVGVQLGDEATGGPPGFFHRAAG